MRSTEHHRAGGRVRCWFPVILAVCLTAQTLPGQVTGGVRGVVRDSMGMGILGVQVTLPGSSMVAETDELGRFELARLEPGMTFVRFRRLGFRPDTAALLVIAGQVVPMNRVLRRVEIALTPVVVYGRAALTGWRQGFYARRDLGTGHFMTKEDIEKRNPGNLTDMLRTVPGVALVPSNGFIRNQVRFRGRRCAPLVWLDGGPLSAGEFDLDALSPRSIEAMEIYTGTNNTPAQYAASPGAMRGCGTILIWSREGTPRRKANTDSSAASSLAKLVDARQVFTASQVDVAARQDSAHSVKPIYPDALHDARISGTVLAEFVVDPIGQVAPTTLSVVFASHPDFAQAVRDALAEATYFPAMRQGVPVFQVVHREFKFIPDSTRRRR